MMVLGLKKNETRPWQTHHRGPIAIHAAANEPAFVRNEAMQHEVFKRVFAEHGMDFKALPRGKILGTVNVDHMIKTVDWVYQNCADPEYTPDEWYFGNYEIGRWAWLTSNPVQFAEPIPAKGSQGFWNFDLPNVQVVRYE